MYIFGYFNFGQKVVFLARRMFVLCWLLVTCEWIAVGTIEITIIRIMDIIPRFLQNLPVLPVLVSVSGGMDDEEKYL